MHLSALRLLFLAALAVAPAAIAQTRYAVGDTVANFSLTDRATGRPVQLTDFAGKIVLLEWFAWWCPFCQAAAAQIEPGIVQHYAARGGNPAGLPVMHVALNLQSGQETQTQQFADTYRLGLVLNDFDRALANRFQSGGQPIFAVINGVAGSPSHGPWQLVYSQLGYGSTQAPLAALRNAIDAVQAPAAPVFSAAPRSAVVAAGGTAAFAAAATGRGPLAYGWSRNGAALAGATGATLEVAVTAATAGIYAVSVTDAAGVASGGRAILGVTTAAKVTGEARELAPANIVHPNGNIFDQVLLEGAAASITADPGQVTRLSFVDLQNDIVQVEFSGAGTVTVTLDNATGPAAPTNYVQPGVSYVKGHASIVVAGADETTHLSVFSVGRANAVNPTLFRDDVVYDGTADLAFIAILSANGRFGGLRAANAAFVATRGLAGIYAPGVAFDGPVFVQDIAAADAATPVFVIGSTPDARIAGGDLFQPNGRAVETAGLMRLAFTGGGTSHGALLPVQTNKARLERDGMDVTAAVVAGPAS